MKSILILFAFILQASFLTAGESYGKWKKPSEASYTMKFVDHMKQDFEKRKKNLEEAGSIHKLDYKYFYGALNKKEQKKQDKFLKGKLSKKEHLQHIKNYVDDLERVSLSLLKAEIQYKTKTLKKDGHYLNEYRKRNIYGEELESTRMAVLLDTSPSMEKHLPAVRKEIKRNFADAYFLEMDGSFLRWNRPGPNSYTLGPWFFVDPYKIETAFLAENHCASLKGLHPHLSYVASKRDNYTAIIAMATIMKVDTIYWFCDMDDSVDERAVRSLAKILKKSGTKLYIHTLKRTPPKLLKKLVEYTGGKVIRKKIR